jgi:hypothetical protein
LQRRERKGCVRSCSRTQKLVVPWARLEIEFCSFYYCPRAEILAGQMLKEKCLLGVNRFSWEWKEKFFPLANWHLLVIHGLPAVCPSSPPSPTPSAMITLLLGIGMIKAYSVTDSCWQEATKGSAVSELTMRGVIEGTTRVGRFHLHQGHLQFDRF